MGTKRACAALLLSLHAVSALAGDLVVLSSRGADGRNIPGLEPGTTLAAERFLDLSAEQQITLVPRTGSKITLRGPYRGTPAGLGGSADDGRSEGGFLEDLAELIKKRELQTMAAFRGLARHPPKRADVWGVNVRREGTVCVRTDRSAILYNPKHHARKSIRLAAIEPGLGETTFEWPAGEKVQPWPDGVALTDGARYRISGAGLPGREFQVRLMPGDLTTDAHRAVWMGKHGCESQAFRALEALEGS